jgi:3D (Asp-Asp-Asp) domain-containing protein
MFKSFINFLSIFLCILFIFTFCVSRVYATSNSIAKLTFSPLTGIYIGTQKVINFYNTSTATIRYITNSINSISSSTVYSGPIPVSSPTTKAVTTKPTTTKLTTTKPTTTKPTTTKPTTTKLTTTKPTTTKPTATKIIDNVKITHYTVALEKNLSGQKTGNKQTITNPSNIRGTFQQEFLYSGWGVAMQGTGISLDDKYIKYVRGGGGWNKNKTWLNNPSSAVFIEVSGIIGKSKRTQTEWYSVAVDTKVIPLGSYIWIESENAWFRADDIGGLIKGNHIDIFAGLSDRIPKSAYSTIYIQSNPPSP